MRNRAQWLKRSALVACVVAGSAGAEAVDAETADVVPYRAVYRVERDGKESGHAVWQVSYDAERDLYRFESSLTVKGVLRLAVPKPIVERGDFKYSDGRISPLEFWYEDGTRTGEDNVHVEFDWSNARAVFEREGHRSEIELRSGMLDPVSMQVASMLDMARGTVDRYVVAEVGEPKVYDYSRTGEALLDMSIGNIAAEIFVQRRLGSSRQLVIWVTPAHAVAPLRMEHQKDGKTETVFVLESLTF